MYLLRILHTVIVWTVMSVVTVILAVVAMAVGNIAPKSGLALGTARLWARLALMVVGSRLTVEGIENIDLEQRYVVMCNHESTVDIPTVLVAVPASIRIAFLAKKSLFAVPFLGRAMRALGFIPVDRKNRSSAKNMFEQSLEGIRACRSPFIFPEATRTKDGRLLPFQRGGFLLALKAGLPILPTGLEGPREVMPDRSILVKPAHIVVRFGSPIDTSEYGVSRRKELTEICRQRIDELRGDRAHLRDEE